MSQDVVEQNIQMWKVKKLIKSLESARGYAILLLTGMTETSSTLEQAPR